MNLFCLPVHLFAQAESVVTQAAPAVVSAATEAASAATTLVLPWYRQGSMMLPITVLTIAVPTLLAWLLSKRLRAADMWGRMATVLVALTAGIVIMAMGWPPRLGIDLKGGVILVYEIDASKRVKGEVDDCIGKIEQLLEKQEGRLGTAVRTADGRIAVSLDTTDAVARESFLKSVEKLDFGDAQVRLASRSEAGKELSLEFDVLGRAAPIDMDKLVAAVSRRVNPGGQKEVTVRRYGLDQLEVIVPDVDQAEVDLIKRIVSSAGVLEFRITANPEDPRHKQVIECATRSAGTTVSAEGRPIGHWVQLDTAKMDPSENRGLVTRATADGRVEALVVLDRFNVTGGYLVRALSSYDSNLQPCVNFSFNSSGAALFGTLTGQNQPDKANRLTSRLGIVLDDTLLSAPTLQSTISGDGQITGSFKQADVEFLVGVLNAGSLPAALYSEPISEQKISPQLGADTIRSGARAMLLAMIVVLSFMLAYYRFSGFVADLAVLLNVVLVIALMISVKAAFTLAGLAGLVLSVGMAVDANVLIYERMREEVDRGAALRMAIRNGFQRAFATIVDSNLTTLITGVVLFAIGTDQLKGFAVTLILGLTLNLFTAVFCSRVLFDLAERNRWISKLSMARLFGQPNFKFVSWMQPAIIGSTAFILLGVAGAMQRSQGLFDIDFTGGASVQVAFKADKGMDVADVRTAVAGLPDVAVSAITGMDGVPDLRYKIDTSLRSGLEVEQKLEEAFPGRLATYSMGFGEIVSTASPTAVKKEDDEKRSVDSQKDAAQQANSEALSTAVALDFPEKINLATLRSTIKDALEAEGIGDVPFELQAEGMTSRTRSYRNWAFSTTLEVAKTRQMLEAVAQKLAGTPVYLSANMIGGKVAGNTKVTAVYALLASMLMIVLYVWVRFQNVAFGLAAVVALAHDVLVTVACLALSKFIAPFMGWALIDDFKISLDVVAALLTIVGFSINDTIVIFDRLREIRGKSPVVSAEMIDKAVNQTLSRTILTSGTAFLATLILFLFGGQGIHAFAFAMLIGIITGTYSTIYIASPIVLWLQQRAVVPRTRGATGRSSAQPA
ncbi:MAG: protein translocase subunit SecD [Planctomycetota bacterium]|nr:MAG: protein translocase subunit SecD [Planctomycetota bacterium]